VGLYIQDVLNLQCKLRPDLSIDIVSESLFIQLTNGKN